LRRGAFSHKIPLWKRGIKGDSQNPTGEGEFLLSTSTVAKGYYLLPKIPLGEGGSSSPKIPLGEGGDRGIENLSG